MLTLLFSSHGIAQNIDEVEPNSTLAIAQDITASFSRVRSADILHSAFLPSVSITATGDNTADYYKVIVNDVDSSYIFDIDYGISHGGSFDSYIYLQNSTGGNIVTNNHFWPASGGGSGSFNVHDSYIKYKFSSTGTYYLKVIRSGRSYVDTGSTYTLQVSKENSSFIVDADEDGMSDEWEAFFSITDPAADLDMDGYSNLAEFTQGSDPSFTDSDNDGLANSEDDDDDNDGVLDVDDAFPLSFAAALDVDGDGHPDVWNGNCNDQCIIDSGLPALDQFPQLAGAWSDTDGDGLVDAVNPTCSNNCAIPSELVDPYPNDFDNDNSSDLVDTDDNGDGNQDADADSDGLIEISSLEELNAMRYELSGTGLQLTSNAAVDSSGCPIILYQGTSQRRCSGYELTQDLDFDSNSDGILDENDLYWNANSSGEGLGWSPVYQFTGIFDGNGFEIKNLYINRSSQDNIGLFGRIDNSTIQNVSLIGPLAEVKGRNFVAGLVGRIGSNSFITNSSVALNITGKQYVAGLIGYGESNITLEGNYNVGSILGSYGVGGLVGYLGNTSVIRKNFNTGNVTNIGSYTGGVVGYAPSENSIVDSFNSGVVEGYNYVGGLVGRLNNDNQISSSYSTGAVKGNSNVGGLVGYKYNNTTVSQSFWAIDSSKQASSAGTTEATSYVGLPLATLKCAIIANTTSDNSSCVSADGSAENLNAALTLYRDWETSTVWGFGTSDQLPALVINSVNYRDNDADGSADVFDAWPDNAAASMDADGDGHPDSWSIGCDDQCIANSGLPAIDQFPQHAGAWLDADFDGLPDAANSDCTVNCDLAGLVMDTNLLDFDNDGSPDLVDSDDDGDGVVDIDADSDGLIDIDSLEKLNAMRFELSGRGLKLDSNAITDSSGCPFTLYQGTYQKRCLGYELTQDLDFDSNQDGILDENDLYWNANSSGEGLGWSPVGNSSSQFSTTFDGNNFEVRNLYINRPTQDYLGLFGQITNATIRNVSLKGSLAQVRGDDYIGALLGSGINNNSILNVSVAINLQGDDYIGGLAGIVSRDNVIKGSSNSGNITGDNYSGGLIGLASYDNVIEGSFNRGKVEGNQNVGGVVGRVSETGTIRTSFNTGTVIGSNYVGGVAGYARNTNTVVDTFSSGVVEGYSYIGGLIGRLENNNQINSSYSTGFVKGSSNTGGLIGNKYSNSVVSQSFWATDSSNQAGSYGASEATGYVGLPLSILKCAIIANTTSDNSSCVSADGSAENLNAALTLYSGWEASAAWAFGANDQIPALVINTINYRDNDNDGSLDSFDAWPNNAAASVDADGDGHPDSWSIGCDDQCIANSGLPALDQFPQYAGAWLDADYDGLPDAVNGDCTVDCDLAGLVMDANLLDFDNDGSPDLVDTDDDGDGIVDIDLDSDGLIDIDSLEKLNAMRFELSGRGFKLDSSSIADSSGCPFSLYQGTYQKRCRGYELTQNLDFDSNEDGVIDVNDLYWNANSAGEGLGWSPVGTNSVKFSTIFEGNNFEIRNLYINQPTRDYLGLFGAINNATIRNVSLTGPVAQVRGDDYIGALVGSANNSSIVNASVAIDVQGDNYTGGLIGYGSTNNTIEESFNSGKVIGNQNIGGLIGRLSSINTVRTSFNTGVIIGQSYVGGLAGYTDSNNNITDTFNSGSVEGNSYVGGLIGRLNSINQVNSSYSIGAVKGSSNIGGLVGYKYSNTVVSQSFWATDSSNQANSYARSEATGYVGLPLVTLKCAIIANTTSDNSSCVSADGSAEGLSSALTLFNGWEASSAWGFGTNEQLPGLTINAVAYRDNDADGSVDSLDAWPNNAAASLDADNDGHPDAWSFACDDQCIMDSGLPALDQFPQYAGAWLDADFDGRPDAVNDTCTVNCDLSGVLIDTALADFDNDGLSDVIDTDDNNDGILDVDVDSDGLIDVDSLEKLNAMRYQLAGVGLQLDSSSVIDSSGCPFVLYQGTYQQRCIGYELTQSLNFDSNLDGTLDENDLYWNANDDGLGLGWSPVGTSTQYAFTGIFEGNGHLVENLFINRPTTSGVGLFGYTNQATIKNVGLTGRLSSLSGNNNVGGIAGHAVSAEIEGVFNTLAIKASGYGAGLVGRMVSGELSNSFNSGSVSCTGRYCAGVVGYAQNSYTIVNTFSSGRILGSSTGGLVGNASSYTIQNSYWATDSSGQVQSSLQNESASYVGITLAKMRCALIADTTSDNSDCVSADGSEENLAAAMTLYSTWDAGIWDFGTAQQLPALKVGASTYRDSDGDGFLDADDGMALRIESSLDADGDGYPDAWNSTCDEQCILASGLQLDRFPNHAGAWQDDDFDGRPDSINETCTVACDLADLELDTNPALSDADNDGIADAVDDDDNGDGIVDVDADSDGLIDIDTLEKLNAMRYQLTGVGLQLSEGADVDRSGCPVIFYEGAYVQRCSGYELTQNLDFDSNQDDDITAEDLYSNVNDSNTVEGWLPIGNSSLPFSTTFNGNGFEIKNFFINRTNLSYVGLFAFLEGASISNVTFSGHLGSVKGNQYVGVLAGKVLGDSILSNIQNRTDVSGSYMSGGIAGRLQANNSVSLASNLAKVEGRNNSYTGGLFGYADSNSSITDSYNAGLITGTNYVGGLVGYNGSGLAVKGVFNTGNISGSSYIGGLFGRLGNSSNLSSAFNTGTVAGTGSRIAGLVGETYYISNISVSFSTGAVTGSADTGGLVGRYSGNARRITNSYWATDTSMQASSASENETDGYVGLTFAALQCATTANTDSANSSCVSADGSTEGLAAALTLYKDWQLSTYTTYVDEVAVEVPYWVFGGDNQLPGLDFKGSTYQDSDNDRIIDSLDGFPLVAIGDLLDTDNDGSPDECDADCLLLGMTADTDDDNDGVLDVVDTQFPLISLEGRTDTDGDGVPDNCGPACITLGMVEDLDDDSDGVLDVNDAYPLIAIGDLLDQDKDGIPNDCDPACEALGMTADTDDDGDGVSDLNDAYPTISLAGRADGDGDGIPDDCDIGCTLRGMVADADNDDDGILDEDDRFPNISIASFLDSDSDGIPDVCGPACIAVGLRADNDDDNDGIRDEKDTYPLIALAGRDDFDGDGAPDNCDTACVAAGMLADPDDDNDGIADVDDAFAFNAAASVDADNDGFPDSWNENCKYTCQVQSGLTIDALLADSDNDGVLDVNDEGLAGDSGVPVISSGPEDMHLAVNTSEGDAVLLSAQQVGVLKASLFARDAVDRFSLLTFKAYMNDAELVETAEGELLIPSGLQTVRWVAIDTSGNTSEAHVQKVYVYPSVSFKQGNSIYGEETTAEIVVELSGPAPEYPVMVSIEAISRLSTITQDDLETEFSISNRHIVVIEAGEDATLNTQASLMVPIIDDEMGEREEVLILELKSFVNASDTYELIRVNADKSLHEMKVTYENLAPVVTLLIKQNGLEVSEIIQGGGAVILEALISDGNGADTHSVTWDVNELGLGVQLESAVDLDVQNLAIGQYRISITAEDDGPSPLSTTLAVDVNVVAVVASPVAPADDKKPDAGALWWMLIMLMGLALLRQQRAFGRHEAR